MLHQRVPHNYAVGKVRGGVHGWQASIFAPMKEYQAVVLRLTRHTREDEDALTDLFNERSRGGWDPVMMAQDDQRLTVIFRRDTENDH